MKQSFPANKMNKYNEQLYSQWISIPPNLPLPNTAQVYTLQLTFLNILYLQQMRQDESLDLKLQWWGMKTSHIISFKNHSEKQTIAKYLVCCPLQGLFSYFSDTKLLAVDIGVKQRSLGKAYLNFLILKGWKGQKYEGLMDIKKQKKKIGQISYSIQISKEINPFVNFSSTPEIIDQSTYTKINVGNKFQDLINDSRRQTMMHQRPVQNQPNYRSPIFQKQTSYKKQVSMQSQIQMKDNRQQLQTMLNYTEIPKKTYHNFNPPLDGINQESSKRYNATNYQMEMVRLIQDYKLLLQKTEYPIDLDHQSDNVIELQIVNIDFLNKQSNQQIEIAFPLANGQQNMYKLGIGSFIKVFISQHLNRDQIIRYLKECIIQCRCDLAQGTIQLSKILSKNNQTIGIPLYQKDKKTGKPLLRGNCYIKAIPPIRQQSKPSISADNNFIQQNANHPPQVMKQIKQQYVLVSIKSFNFIQFLNRKINILARIIESQNNQILGETKTLWNCDQNFIFQEKLTFQVKSNSIVIQMIDRQKYENILGQGVCLMDGPIGINKQIPIIAKKMNKSSIIGYLSLDFVKNGLQSVTKMADIIGKTCNHLKTTQINNSLQIQKQNLNINQNQENFKEINEQKNNNFKEKYQQLHKQNSIQQQQQKEVEKDKQDYKKKMQQQFERNLSELQIYNKFFTYLYEHTQIAQKINNKSQMKITQFLDIFQEVQQKQILRLKELNLLISKHLFSNQNNQVNKIDVTKLKQSYDSFCTYYQEIAQERDIIIRQFLNVLENVGLSINELQFKLKNNRKIWDKLNQFLSFGKGEKINIVEDLRIQFQDNRNTNTKLIKDMTGSQFCDLLRKFQVYQTTLGLQINHSKLAAHIYQHLCQIISEIEPQIASFSYRQLITLLEQQQIVLSQWEKINMFEHMNVLLRKSKQIDLPYAQTNKLIPKDIKREQQIKQNLSHFDNKPTISKSPTFGYLQPLQAVKDQLNASDSQMVDSLAVKMQNLAISPINYNSSKEEIKELKAVLSNLRYKPTGISIDQRKIQFNLTNNYWSKQSQINKKDNITSKNLQSQNEQKESGLYIESKTIKSFDDPSRKQYKSDGSSTQNKNIEVTLQHINKKFNYLISIDFQQEQAPIIVQCMHQEWTALMNDQGEYLGGILIY